MSVLRIIQVRTSAFSLIELMVVIAIVTILAAVAVPAYKNYSDRAKIATGLALAGPAVDAVKMYISKNNGFPADPRTIGVAFDDDYWVGPTSGGAVAYNVDSDIVNQIAIVTYDINMVLRTNSTAFIVSYKAGVNPQYPNAVSSLFYVLYEDPVGSGILKFKCGQWADSVPGQSMPLEVMPTNCQDTNLAGFSP